MRKNIVQKVIVHVADDADLHALAAKVSKFHVEIIERKLSQSNLTTEQKIIVINKVIEHLKSREVNGMIK